MKNHDIDPIISIIVPVYGTEQYFDRCICSLQNQSYKNLEIIVVNDGSQGNISELINNYMDDSRIKFINNVENKGLLRARVCGSKMATGDYIAFVDSDDYVSFDYYRTLLDRAQMTGSDITVGKTVWVKGNEKIIYNYHEACFRFDTLQGDEIRKTFFGQEFQCYSWHTIWNKLYRKDLWDKCLEEFERINRHVVMTEDIFFSSILFYNANLISRTENDAYFYCMNENASTNSKQITIERYCKNLDDIKFVFDSVEDYLVRCEADEDILHGLKKGKQHYARMWKNLAENVFQDDARTTALTLVDRFCDNVGDQKVKDDYYFESVQTRWNAGLEYIKEKIRDCDQQYISFDVFDTLIKRPFYDPEDMFELMNIHFSKISGNNISFSVLRKQAEMLARLKYGEKLGVEDITIDEIYDFISEHFGIPKNNTDEMQNLECSLEKRFCLARNTGVELFNLAKCLGKRVVLITDMYLDRKTIEAILFNNGIHEYESLFISSEERCLKYNGHLFARALSSLKTVSSNILHIGDGWISDIEGSKKAGIESVFLPKAIEMFENKIQGNLTNRCADIGKDSCGEYIDYQKTTESLGYRCMQAIAANEYFDNPYRTFDSDSDFNMDADFIGFYLLGMHILGILKWIDENVTNSRIENLLFLARDGFLPMQAYELYKKYLKGIKPNLMYVQASRKALLPLMIKEPLNLYQLPIEYRAHSPKTLLSVLDFMVKDGMKENLCLKLENAGIEVDKPFQNLEELHFFIELFIKEFYDSEKHQKQKGLVRKYYRDLPEKSVAFDMGYSGRIQAALCDAAGKRIDVLFLHEDYKVVSQMKDYAGFKVNTFYEYYPSISGLMREHLFSDCNGSCIGFDEIDSVIVPKFEEKKHYYPDSFVVDTLQNGAMRFVQRFMNFFAMYPMVMDYSSVAVSIPFEGFLRRPSKNDMHIFSASYFEDLIFGARESINIEEFAMQNLAAMGWIPRTSAELAAEEMVEETIHEDDMEIINMINHSAQWKRALTWILLDRGFFKEKLHLNLNRIMKRQ